MRKIFVVICLFSGMINATAQESGMQFVHNVSWQKILDKAKADNKYIFVDCYATWCGPCKMMAAKVFPLAEVGVLYNSNYINVKAQMDTSAADNADIKARYADNHILLTQYQIGAYPTYLIFNPNGELVQRFLGSMTADEFITKGKEALLPENQYYTQLRAFQKGERSPAFLNKLIKMSLNADDMKNGNLILDAYLQTQSDLFSKENLELILSFASSSNTKGFEMMMESPEKVDAVMGKDFSSGQTMAIMIDEEMRQRLFSSPADSLAANPNWNSLQSELAKKYPTRAKEIVSLTKVYFYKYNKQWELYGPAAAEYVKEYKDQIKNNRLNDFAWYVYKNCSDPVIFAQALEWSKKTVESDNNSMYMDTYAHLMMRAGRHSEAVEWETKALATAKARNASESSLRKYEKELAEMKAKN